MDSQNSAALAEIPNFKLAKVGEDRKKKRVLDAEDGEAQIDEDTHDDTEEELPLHP